MRSRVFIEQAIADGYELDISSYFSKGWELFKKNPGGFIGYLFIYGLILLVINLIPFLGFIINIIVSPALAIGWLIMANKLSENAGDDFGYFFKGFDKLSELIVSAIIQFVITMVVALPIILILIFTVGASALFNAGINNDFNFGIGIILGLFAFAFILAYIAMCMRWSYHLIYFHNFTAMESITKSFKLINKRPLQHLILVIMFFFAALGGMLAMIIGLFVAVPLIYCTDYCAYEDVSGMRKENEDAGYIITDNLV